MSLSFPIHGTRSTLIGYEGMDLKKARMYPPAGDADHALPIRPAPTHLEKHLALPAPPSPSADISIVPEITSPTKEIQDPGVVPQTGDINIFKLSPLAALKMLIGTVQALIDITGDFSPTPPVSIGRLKVVSLQKENQPAHSRSSSIDRRKSQPPPPPGWEDAEHVPERAKTPIGSPELRPTDPLHIDEPGPKPPRSQQNVVARKFNSKKPPPISLQEYLTRLQKYCPMSTGVYLATGLYIYRLAIIERSVPVTARNCHRLLLAALRVAGKANDDRTYPHKRFAIVGGVSESELAKLEIAFCYVIDFELRVTREMLEEHARVARDYARMPMRLSNIEPRLPVMLDKRNTAVQQGRRETEETEVDSQATG